MRPQRGHASKQCFQPYAGHARFWAVAFGPCASRGIPPGTSAPNTSRPADRDNQHTGDSGYWPTLQGTMQKARSQATPGPIARSDHLDQIRCQHDDNAHRTGTYRNVVAKAQRFAISDVTTSWQVFGTVVASRTACLECRRGPSHPKYRRPLSRPTVFQFGVNLYRREIMQSVVKSVSLVAVALGLCFVVSSPARADGCCTSSAACCVTVHHGHHGCHWRHACCPVVVTPDCRCATCAGCAPVAPTATVTTPVLSACAPCCTVPVMHCRCRAYCRPCCRY